MFSCASWGDAGLSLGECPVSTHVLALVPLPGYSVRVPETGVIYAPILIIIYGALIGHAHPQQSRQIGPQAYL